MFWGDRFGTITDPYGHLWSIATHTRDLAGGDRGGWQGGNGGDDVLRCRLTS